jgi:predicted MFS family arabinose efflux permease
VLLTLFAVSASLGAMTRLGFEFNQLWYIKLHLPLVFFGIFNASVFLMLVVRGQVLGLLHMERFRLLTILLVAGAVSTIGLTAKNPYLAATAVTISMFFGLCAELVLITLQQKRFTSNVRAGAASVLSTATHLAFIPAGFLFGVLVDYKGISVASWFLTVLFTLAAFAAHKARRLEHATA